MARIRQHLSYSDTRAELIEHKDAKRGAMEDAFWDEDEPVDHRPKRNKKKPGNKKGCPGNEGKSHIYVWVDYNTTTDDDDPWFRRWYQDYEVKICCGCEKRASGFRKKSQ